jgi:hypothetical protein
MGALCAANAANNDSEKRQLPEQNVDSDKVKQLTKYGTKLAYILAIILVIWLLVTYSFRSSKGFCSAIDTSSKTWYILKSIIQTSTFGLYGFVKSFDKKLPAQL